VAGAGGARKARVKKGGKGKRGGPRAIYFFHVLGKIVYMLAVYAKSEKDDLSPEDKKALQAVATQIKAYDGKLIEAAKNKAREESSG
jgi:hypothetical protein